MEDQTVIATVRLAVLCLGFVTLNALAADAADRRFVREGMSEGEVIMKIGRPDSESVDSGGGAKVAVKRWMYFPTSGDSQTMTTITIRDGKVTEVSRQVSR
jgi:Protein of unknown function (DUF2845)